MILKKRILCLTIVACILFLVACNDRTGDSNTTSEDLSSDLSNINSLIESGEDSLNSTYSTEDTSSEEVVSSYSSEVTSTEDVSSNTTIDSQSSDLSLDSVSSSDETSVNNNDNNLFCYQVLSPELKYNLSWEENSLQLYNTEFRMSSELQKKLADCLNSYKLKQSVILIELETGMTFAFEKDQKIATASSIKGPFGLFVYKAIESGLLDWNTKITYRSSHYQKNSTGKVQNSSFGTEFTVEKLMDYMIRISDNQAYLMFKSTLGRDRFEKMMGTLGCDVIIPSGSNWGYITAEEMAAAWREIYYYSLHNEMGAELFQRFMEAYYNYIWRAIPQYEAAHKSGWSGKAFNDAGVVFADGREYVLVNLCARNGVYDDGAKYQFTKTTKLLAELMVEYNKYLDGDAANDNDDSNDVTSSDTNSSADVNNDNNDSSDVPTFETSDDSTNIQGSEDVTESGSETEDSIVETTISEESKSD